MCAPLVHPEVSHSARCLPATARCTAGSKRAQQGCSLAMLCCSVLSSYVELLPVLSLTWVLDSLLPSPPLHCCHCNVAASVCRYLDAWSLWDQEVVQVSIHVLRC